MTSSQFADEIGVQRSSVSHVMSGRNKPGFDFIQKILSKFPEINADWLITGAGEMLKKINMREQSLFEIPERRKKEKELKYEDETQNKRVMSNRDIFEKEKDKKKQIEKLIIIYNDNSFEEYYPS